MGHTLCTLAIPVEARSAFAGIGRHATSAILAGSARERERGRERHAITIPKRYSLLTNRITTTLDLEVARPTAALTRRRAFSILAILTDRSTAAIRIGTISWQAVALVGRHTASISTARITVGLAVLAANGIQCVTLSATAFVLLIAYPIATAQGAGRDALALRRTHMSRYTDTCVGRRTDAIGTAIVTDRFTDAIDMGVTLVTLATDLYATQFRRGTISHYVLRTP